MATAAQNNRTRRSWTIEERTFCVQRHNVHGSFKILQNEFLNHFQCEKFPPKSVIHNWLTNFKAYGSVRNQNSASNYKSTHSGRPKKRSAEAIELVRASVEEDPKRSVRKRAQSLNLHRNTCWRILRKDVPLYPYRIETHQVLVEADKLKRKAMATKIVEKTANSPTFLRYLWTSDEAHFHLHGHVNSKNNIIWGTEKPKEVASTPLHSPKCTVWAAISMLGVIGPYFFENEDGETTTVNKERYIEVLEKFRVELSRQYPGLMRKFWFQQDGAAPHTSKLALDWLKNNFGTRLVSLKTEFEWAPHSPDLSPPDFFLWGYLKEKVFQNSPQTIIELKENIRQEMQAIPASVCKNVMENFIRRLKACVDQNGSYVENMM